MKKYFILFLITLFTFSCSEKFNDPFSGEDNYIHSFALKLNNDIISAKISDSKIFVEVPYGTNITNAKATFEICENSTITPDPATITNWDNSVSFIVSSYSGEKREYKFEIKYTSISVNSDVVLNTQEEVNAFGLQNVTKISGSLKLGFLMGNSTDSIKNLEPLSKLEIVDGSLMIGNGILFKETLALSNLKSVGNLYIGTLKSSVNFSDSLSISLPSLNKVGEIIINSTKVKELNLPNLNTAYNIYINCKGIKLFELPKLKNIIESLTVQASTLLPDFNLESLNEVGGNLNFNTLHILNSVQFPNLQTIGGDFICKSLPLCALIDLPKLTTVSKNFTCAPLEKCETISAPQLKSVASMSLQGSYSSKCISSLQFPVLENVDQTLELQYLSAEEIKFPALLSVGSRINISSCETAKEIYIGLVKTPVRIDLGSVKAAEKIALPKIISELYFSCYGYTEVPEIKGAEEITTRLYISNVSFANLKWNNTKKVGTIEMTSGDFTSLTFSDLEEVSTLKLSLYNLLTLSAPKLEKIENVNMDNMWLCNYEFPVLKEITNTFKFWGATYAGGATNCKITDLNGFSNVSKIGKVDIKWCANLSDFSAFKNAIPSLTEENWSVLECKYNPTFKDMTDGNYVQ